MFSDLIKFLKDKNYFIETEVKELPKSCCLECEIPILDFFEIKEKFQQETQQAQPPSVNGLLFTDSNRLAFVRTESTREYYTQLTPQNLVALFMDNKLDEKVDGTVQALSNIISHHKFSADFETLYSSAPRKSIHPIVLAELTDAQYLYIIIGYFDKLNLDGDGSMIGTTLIMNCVGIQNYFNTQ